MEKFQVGEKVICILNNRASLTVGKEYQIEGIDYDDYDDCQSLNIFNDSGNYVIYTSSRFMSKSEFRKFKINEIIDEKD